MIFRTKISLAIAPLLLLSGCFQPSEPEMPAEYDKWLRYMVHTVYDRSQGQSIASFQNEKSNFSTYGIAGFTDDNVRQLDGILLADYSPYHPWDSRTENYSYPYLITKAIFRFGQYADMGYQVSFDEKNLGADSRAFYRDETYREKFFPDGQWSVRSSSGTITERIAFPDSLTPVTLSADTISISEGATIRWSNPVSGSFVVINFLNWGNINEIINLSPSYYIRTGIMVPDTGAYTFSKKDFLYAGIEPEDIVSIKLIRGKFYSKEFPEIHKKFGFLSTTTAAIQFRTKE